MLRQAGPVAAFSSRALIIIGSFRSAPISGDSPNAQSQLRAWETQPDLPRPHTSAHETPRWLDVEVMFAHEARNAFVIDDSRAQGAA